ncbi:MAG TPA: T9SS type A sorting domain-containing protein [Bacteroidota bacterium]|nr:T9SS type A sorting domain-containing protein [Bacteroidota bacterium]
MKKTILFALCIVLTFLLVGTSNGLAQSRNVTFVINTATVPDTVVSSYSVAITGDKAAITGWGAGIAATNIGGDYWSKTIAFTQGDTIRFKFRLAGAWENDSNPASAGAANDRTVIVGGADTTLPVQFPNYTGGRQDQYWRPWASHGVDTTIIYLRTNMQGTSKPFNPNTDTVGVRGDKEFGPSLAPDFGWSPTRYLKKEALNANFAYNGANFWSGYLKLPKTKFSGGDTVKYKFLIGYDWGKDEANDRRFRTPVTKNDTTIYWTWYNDEKPVARANPDTVNVTFNVDMATAVQKSLFDVTNDTVQVQFGFFGTADSQYTMNLVRQGLTNRFQGTKNNIRSKIGSPFDYQFYWVKGGATIREYFYNFQYTGSLQPEAERRQLNVPTKTFTVKDTVVSVTDGRRQPHFENQRKLTKTVLVTWKVDLRPAYYTIKLSNKTLTDIQGSYNITPAFIDSIKKWGVAINGPATGGWQTWGSALITDTTRKMYDDATHGDAVANDSIWTRQISYTTANNVGQVFKFGIRGGDNESAFGLNHLANIDDTNPTFTIDDQFGSINPIFYQNWDFTNKKPILTSVEQLSTLPEEYDLRQNYPNPFNPSTKIEFTLPHESNVTLTVYNLLGQAVATLVNENLKAGSHAVNFNASKLSSGIYFYRITAGSFVSLKKMVLLK